MFMVQVNSTSIHILEAVANSVLLDKMPMPYPKLLLPVHMSSVVSHRTFTTKLVANFYRLDAIYLGGTS